MNTKEPEVNVGILSTPRINFFLDGDFESFPVKKRYSGAQTVECKNKKIIFNDEICDEIVFFPTTASANFEVKDVVIGKNFHWEQKENQRFMGILKFIVEEENVTLVNRLPIEDYLTSVISSEMNAHSSFELLKAHAVISRSWLLAQINKPKKNTQQRSCEFTVTEEEKICWYDKSDHLHFDVCADDHCQRYQGITKANLPKVREAVMATCGEILTYFGKICDARFSKSCGGVTELFENCWEDEPHPYLVKVVDNVDETDENAENLTDEMQAEKWIRSSPDSFCNTSDEKILSQILNSYDRSTSDFYRWKVEYSQKTLSEIIEKQTGLKFGAILDLIPVERGVSGRLVKLKIRGSECSLIVGKELEIRKVLSETHLYSSAFIIEKHDEKGGIPQRFILYGAGWGHGVGLCQIGAAVMAEKNYDYKNILTHYYKGAFITSDYGL